MKFTEDQRIWIVEAYAASKSPASVRRAFLLKYGIRGRKKNDYRRADFTHIFSHFRETGAVQRKQGSGKKAQNPEAKALIKFEFERRPEDSLRNVARKLDFSKTYVHKIAKNELKLKPYKFHKSQELTENHKKQRNEFCEWVVTSKIDPQKIIFSDEKFFVLRPHPNKQNARFWSCTNPHLYDDSLKQGAEKIMAWADMVNGRILPIVWFQEGQSVNTEIYLKLLQNDMWPAVRHDSDRENYYFQQCCIAD